MFLNLLSEARVAESDFRAEINLAALSYWEEAQEREIDSNVKSETERIALIRARVGLGTFRQRVSTVERA